MHQLYKASFIACCKLAHGILLSTQQNRFPLVDIMCSTHLPQCISPQCAGPEKSSWVVMCKCCSPHLCRTSGQLEGVVRAPLLATHTLSSKNTPRDAECLGATQSTSHSLTDSVPMLLRVHGCRTLQLPASAHLSNRQMPGLGAAAGQLWAVSALRAAPQEA